MLIHVTREEWEHMRTALVRSGKLSDAGSKFGKVIAFPVRVAEPISNILWAL